MKHKHIYIILLISIALFIVEIFTEFFGPFFNTFFPCVEPDPTITFTSFPCYAVYDFLFIQGLLVLISCCIIVLISLYVGKLIKLRFRK